MRNNREFTIDDVKAYAENLGYALDFQRYKRVFTLRDLSSSDHWSWIYLPHSPGELVELVDDLSFDEWKLAVDITISSIKC
jgi:hypothetical protein